MRRMKIRSCNKLESKISQSCDGKFMGSRLWIVRGSVTVLIVCADQRRNPAEISDIWRRSLILYTTVEVRLRVGGFSELRNGGVSTIDFHHI